MRNETSIFEEGLLTGAVLGAGLPPEVECHLHAAGKGYAYLHLRLGGVDEGRAAAMKLLELDPGDKVGARAARRARAHGADR